MAGREPSSKRIRVTVGCRRRKIRYTFRKNCKWMDRWMERHGVTLETRLITRPVRSPAVVPHPRAVAVAAAAADGKRTKLRKRRRREGRLERRLAALDGMMAAIGCRMIANGRGSVRRASSNKWQGVCDWRYAFIGKGSIASTSTEDRECRKGLVLIASSARRERPKHI